MEKKVFEIEELKKTKEDGKFYIEGYANTKNKADRYGDIPKGNDVYDLKHFKKNPVAFVDHINSASNIAGNFIKIQEDEIGLKFKLLLRNIDDVYVDNVKDAISAYQTGFGKALSIGGQWIYDEKERKDGTRILVKAIIHEISLVGVGADPHALSNSPQPKKLENLKKEEAKSQSFEDLKVKYGSRRINIINDKINKLKKEI